LSVSAEIATDKSVPRLRSGALNLIETNGQSLAAILLCGGMLALACVAMLPAGLLNAFGCAGTFASFGFVVVYFALCIVAPMDLKKSREMKPRHVMIAVAGAALMTFVIVGSVYPVPQYPYNVLPYLFFAYMAIGAVWFARLKSRSPQILASIGRDMEG
jgi:amino acid transporter